MTTESSGEQGTIVVICPRCAKDLPKEAHFCTKCGYELTPSVQVAAEPTLLRKVCRGCRTVNDFSFSYCYNCGLPLPAEGEPASRAVGNPAGFWVRLIAFLIDRLLIEIARLTAMVLITGVNLEDLGRMASGLESLPVIAWVTATVLEVGYYTITTSAWSQTVGKWALGLKVVRRDGTKISYARALARYWAYYVSFIPVGLGFLAIALSPEKRSWHDLICDTRVLKVAPQ